MSLGFVQQGGSGSKWEPAFARNKSSAEPASASTRREHINVRGVEWYHDDRGAVCFRCGVCVSQALVRKFPGGDRAADHLEEKKQSLSPFWVEIRVLAVWLS